MPARVWVDGGEIRLDGSNTNVVSRYESAFRLSATQGRNKAISGKAQFESWGIIDPPHEEPHTLGLHGPLTIRFVVHAATHLHRLHHGIALYDSERHILWGTGSNGLHLEPGLNELTYQLSGLPVKPGIYTWRVTLFDEFGPIDDWDCVPEMKVATEPVGHWLDEWAGLLNIPYAFRSSLVEQFAGNPFMNANAISTVRERTPIERLEGLSTLGTGK